MRYRSAVGRTRVKRRRISWASENYLPKRSYFRWINAIGQIVANVATSITTIDEADRVGDRKKACINKLTPSARIVGK
jgi:hypothetical protein